ncbi:MAG: nucleotide exchange factor GrpE [Nitrospinae bacterium RIFCSPLOWO2_12_FULL_47_7]|nr:MAG: nucleotide exchange factor GrpE [Nitrospinae bacterium RIFCSPLOWO2_12_FULL_47_7]
MSDDNTENKNNEETPKFKFKDTRHWATGDNAEGAADEERLPTYVEKLKQESEEKDKRLREYIAAYKTKTAETDEFRARLQRENDVRLDQLKANLFGKLVPILDNLKRASSATGQNRDIDSLRSGIDLIVTQFNKILQENEVQVIEAKGRAYNPATDEVCFTVETQDPEQDNMVLEDLEPGYQYHDKLIKAVKVKVAKLKK